MRFTSDRPINTLRPMTKVSGTLFFGFFLVLGLIFTAITSWGAWENLRTWTWAAIDCTILDSGIEEREGSDGGYRFVVRYRFELAGKVHESDVYRPGYAGGNDYGDALRLTERYPSGATVRGYVSSDASLAVLQRGSLWMPLLVPFPLVFVTIGAGGIWIVWRREDGVPPPDRRLPVSQPQRQLRGLVAFFALFALIGGGILGAWFVPAAIRIHKAQSWDEVPATVISSRVRRHDGGEDTTYSVDILYRYEVDGREYRSNRYDFIGGSSSGYRAKRDLVRQHPPGAEVICYVDPDDPGYAVLNRDFHAGMLVGLIPLAFLLVGLVGGGLTIRHIRNSARRSTEAKWLPDTAGNGHQPYDSGAAGPSAAQPAPLVLSSGRKRLGIFAFLLLFTLAWNSLIWWLLVFGEVVPGWREGAGLFTILSTLFAVPFVLAGVVLVGLTVYFGMALLNPAVRVKLASDRIHLGDAVELQWELCGRHDRLRRLRICLEGREELVDQDADGGPDGRGGSLPVRVPLLSGAGDDDPNLFRRIEIVDTSDRYGGGQGRATLRVPAGTMHSFEGRNCRIRWTLVVRGEIGLWPDVQDEWGIVVRPMPVEKLIDVGTADPA